MNYLRQTIYLALLVVGSVLISKDDGSTITIGVILISTAILNMKSTTDCLHKLKKKDNPAKKVNR